ncbi:proheparin-binding EGF-like growth factor isoform X1 [Girardinichthys multiradiatus]|uniref:proheparin-binding EGF-like growth factor isoform X1 n=1 Tax=Girardinichthys multiradiatus TaxID=208333 RepID=UPI001FAB3BC8|nr:proheparin-binding EGF-like growth factor isoform X1 [Girardinichthys multiradiatus]
MNTLIIISLLCIVVCSALGAQGSEDTYSGELARVTAGPASGEGHLHSQNDDDEVGVEEELSGGDNENVILHVLPVTELHADKDERRKRKGKSKRKNRQKSKSTTPFNPEHTFLTSGHTSTLTSTQDPCTSTHLGYCIHGYCKYIEGLREPVCICMKGYDGERCGIQTLESFIPDKTYNTELPQTVLVVIAVVLSVISCCAILLLTCAHYRSHKNFLASYLGSGSEQEKLQKPMGDVVV